MNASPKGSTIHNFDGQTAIVTGGAQGIGLAVTKRLVAGGAKVAVWDMDSAALTTPEGMFGNAIAAFAVDISDLAAVESAMAATVDRLGEVQVLVNSAGIAGPNAPVTDYPPEAWSQIMRVNLDGTFYTNRTVVARMKATGYGRIVNVASVAGKEGNPNASAYSASKAGVMAFTKSLGKEVAGQDIAVNCVTPAAARTRIFDQMKQEHIDYMLSRIPRGRFLEVDEAASMIVWLCTAENSFTTGAVFDLSGGRATY